jgi:hypothetical protein
MERFEGSDVIGYREKEDGRRIGKGEGFYDRT